jgi:uncharacterized protein YggE
MRTLLVFLLALPLLGQQVTTRRSVRAIGEGSISVQPDVARVSLGVVTQADTAGQAASENATRASAVIDQLRALLGSGAEIRTASYSLTPNYGYQSGGAPAAIVGFTATNIVEALVADLSLIGRVIDTGIQAGANRVDSLRLTLNDEEPSRAQALRQAGQKARARAEAIAAGVGVRLGQVISAEEGVSYGVIPLDARATTAATTPIQPGSLEVRANVTLEIEIVP